MGISVQLAARGRVGRGDVNDALIPKDPVARKQGRDRVEIAADDGRQRRAELSQQQVIGVSRVSHERARGRYGVRPQTPPAEAVGRQVTLASVHRSGEGAQPARTDPPDHRRIFASSAFRRFKQARVGAGHSLDNFLVERRERRLCHPSRPLVAAAALVGSLFRHRAPRRTTRSDQSRRVVRLVSAYRPGKAMVSHRPGPLERFGTGGIHVASCARPIRASTSLTALSRAEWSSGSGVHPTSP
jgi:hypothetical protein